MLIQGDSKRERGGCLSDRAFISSKMGPAGHSPRLQWCVILTWSPRAVSLTCRAQQALALAMAVLEACVGGTLAALEDATASSFYFSLLRALRALVPQVRAPPPCWAPPAGSAAVVALLPQVRRASGPVSPGSRHLHLPWSAGYLSKQGRCSSSLASAHVQRPPREAEALARDARQRSSGHRPCGSSLAHAAVGAAQGLQPEQAAPLVAGCRKLLAYGMPRGGTAAFLGPPPPPPPLPAPRRASPNSWRSPYRPPHSRPSSASGTLLPLLQLAWTRLPYVLQDVVPDPHRDVDFIRSDWKHRKITI